MENKTLIFILLLVVANIGLSSAWDGDNIYNYDPVTKTATIENLWGLPIIGSDLAYVTLTSPHNVIVARGEDKLIGEFNFTTTDDFTDTFNDIYLTNLKNGNSISRGQQFKYKKYKNISVDDYETICNDVLEINGSVWENCTQVEIGNHWEIKMDWMPVNNPTNTFYSGITYEIGIFIDVEKGDYGDWVPSIMGVEIEEWATWTASLNANIISYWKLDNNSFSDSLGLNNLTNTGTTNTTGIIIDGRYFDGSGNSLITQTGVISNNYTANAWVNISDDVVDNRILCVNNNDQTNGNCIAFSLPARNISVLQLGVGWSVEQANESFVDNEFHMFTLTWDGSDSKVYVDSSLVVTFSGDGNAGTNFTLGSSTLETSHFIGVIDEVGFWNRVLTQSELDQLNNSGMGITWADVFAPNMTILFPQNITYNETITQLNYTNSSNAVNCWFSIDGGVTNSSAVICGTNFTTASVIGSNTWTIYGNESLGNIGTDSITFFVNKSVQTELLLPTNNSNFTTTQIDFSMNSIPVNTNLTNVTLFVWYDNETLFLTNTTILSGDSETTTNFTSNLTQGNFIWNAETCSNDAGCSFAGNNRTLTIHTTPSTVIIHFPNETITFLEVGGNLSLNWTILEPGQNLSEHIINCSYVYNGVTTGLNQSQCISINETSFLYVAGVNNLTFTVLEEFGIISQNTTSWDFLFEKYNVTFNNETFEGFQETFTAEIILKTGESISQAIFYHNNVNYSTNIIFSGGEYTVSSSITIPSVDADTNVSLGFFITVGGTIYNLTSFQQQIFNINFTNCSISNDTVLNMSLFNEETRASILGDIQINAQAIGKTSGQITASTNLSFSNVSSGAICLTPSGAYSNLYFTTEIRYVSDNFVPEFYHIQLADMTDFPRNLSLFDLATNDSTEFSITYQDDSLIPVEGAIIQLQRKYISLDIWEVVEAPLTSNTGSATVHIDLNTNKYRASVVKNGVLLDFFDNIVFDCESELSGECTELLLGTIDPQNNIPLINLTDFSYFISSAGNTITTTFIVPSGTPSNINVVLTQLDQFGNETTCNQSVLSSAGSIDCDFNATIGDSFLSLQISKDAELKAQQTFIVVEDTNLDFLGNNFFIVIIILLSLVGMAITSPEWMIINAVVVMLIGGAFWLLNGMNFVMGLGSLIWLVVSAIILIIKLAKQEDR